MVGIQVSRGRRRSTVHNSTYKPHQIDTFFLDSAAFATRFSELGVLVMVVVMVKLVGVGVGSGAR